MQTVRRYLLNNNLLSVGPVLAVLLVVIEVGIQGIKQLAKLLNTLMIS